MFKKWGLVVLSNMACLSTIGQRVGIGTTSPVAKLHVEVPSGIAYPAFQINQQGSAVPYLLIQPNGNVGIGVANPTEALDVSGNVQFSGALMPGGNAGTVGQVLVSQGPGVPPMWLNTSAVGDNWGSQVAQTQSPVVGDGTSGSPITLQSGTANGEVLIYDGTQWQIKQAPWDSVCNTALNNMVQKWTGSELCNSQIYDDGTNVGIGTTTPSYRLHVAGSVYVQDSLRIDGDFRPAGNPGAPGQILVSNGPGVAPSWTTFSTGGSGISGCASCPTMLGPQVNINGDSVGCGAQNMSWVNCVRACAKSTYGGFTDWRMPSFNEILYLTTITDPISCPNYYYWTSTPYAYNGFHPDSHLPSSASHNYYIFYPDGGYWGWNGASWISPYCRCVR